MCFKAKDTSARDKTSDENEDLRNQITDVQQSIPVSFNDIFILTRSSHPKLYIYNCL